jgi:5-methyltetrahydropteroyltriglutamate--homocysteine methyltransferase
MTVLTNRTHAPFRYDIVGSFLRPAALKKARADFAENKITFEQLTAIENICIRDLVKKEIAAGLHSVTDGEFRRSYWHLDFMWGFSGIEHIVLDHGYLFHGEETRADSARVIGKIRFTNHPFLTHFRFLKQIAGNTVVCRQTIPGPAQFFSELVRGENEKYLNAIYPDREEACQDLIRAYHDFILALYEEGCRNLQLDDCTWGMLCDINYWKNQSGGETNVQSLQELYLRLTNGSIADLPKDLIINTHVCRGNYHSTWATSGGYGPVGKILFGKENVTGYYLEFDDDRSGDFTPLQDVSDNKMVVLGLITSKKPKLENKAAIISRIKEAAQFIPLDRLCLSPQCGFSSTEEGNILTEEDQWKKIALVKEIADEVWS